MHTGQITSIVLGKRFHFLCHLAILGAVVAKEKAQKCRYLYIDSPRGIRLSFLIVMLYFYMGNGA